MTNGKPKTLKDLREPKVYWDDIPDTSVAAQRDVSCFEDGYRKCTQKVEALIQDRIDELEKEIAKLNTEDGKELLEAKIRANICREERISELGTHPDRTGTKGETGNARRIRKTVPLLYRRWGDASR